MRKIAKDLIERNKRLTALLNQPLDLFNISFGELPNDQDGDYFFSCIHPDLILDRDSNTVLCTKCNEVFEENSCEL